MIPQIFQWVPFENELYRGGTLAVIMRFTEEEFEEFGQDGIDTAARAFGMAVRDYRDSFWPETYLWRRRPQVARSHEFESSLEVIIFSCRIAWSKARSPDGALPRELHMDPHQLAVGGLLYP